MLDVIVETKILSYLQFHLFMSNTFCGHICYQLNKEMLFQFASLTSYEIKSESQQKKMEQKQTHPYLVM